MIIFIPTNDLASLASQATTTDELDFGEVLAESVGSVSFRLGNLSGSTVDYSFSIDHDPLNDFPLSAVTLPPDGQLQADGTSDTLTVRLEPPVSSGNRPYVLTLTATAENGTSSLEMRFTVVVDRDKRRSEYPERATSQTDVFSGQIDRAAEWIELLRYEPVAYDPCDNRVMVERGSRYLSEGGDIEYRSQCDPCERLNALNPDWGYVLSSSWIRGVVAPETDELSLTFVKTNTGMTYSSTSSVIVPAEYHGELQRSWALFAPASGPDREQFKRTVFAFERGSELWAILDIVSPPLGDIITYLQARCVQVHNADQGSPQFFNPWAWTYERDSDKPYSMYSCEISSLVETFQDASASGMSNASNPSQ